MRVLQVTTDTDRRGAQIFAAELAPMLEERSWQVRTTALAPGTREASLPFEVLGRRRLAPATLRSLRSVIKASDVVIGFGSTTLPACSAASFTTGVPFIYRSIGDLRYWVTTPGKRIRVRHLLRRATAVVALWPGAAATIVHDFGVDAARVRVIPRGVDETFFRSIEAAEQPRLRGELGLPLNAPIAAVVGSLTTEKGVTDAIAAVATISGMHLVVAGGGPLEQELRTEAAWRAPGRVHFLGNLTDTRPVYGAADLLLVPSLSEGVPGVVIEAGMSGCAAVATDVGGTSSIIEHGVTGHLVRPSDHEALIAAIHAVLRRSDELGRAARDSYRTRFSLRLIGEHWANLLRSVVP